MTGDEMQIAIEFLLKSQTNFETRFDESDRQWNTRFEESNRQLNALFEDSHKQWKTEFEETKKQWRTQLEDSNKQWITRFELEKEETNRRIAQTNQVVEALADTQADFTQTMLRFITLQTEFNTWTRQKLSELDEGLKRTQQEISDLTKAINNFMKFSSGNGNLPPE